VGSRPYFHAANSYLVTDSQKNRAMRLKLHLLYCLFGSFYFLLSNSVSSSSSRVVEIINPESRRLAVNVTQCDLQAYKTWFNKKYTGTLAADSAFWMYQTQTQITLSNGLAMGLAHSNCKRLFDSLYFYRAGRMGPISIQDSYKIMCKSYCLEMDSLHEAAMAASQCSCLELSTPKTDTAFTREGDWCFQNSARMLCNIIGYCGVWNCRVSDYMCPRYEWNKKIIPLKGPGTCIRGSSPRVTTISSFVALSVIIVFLFNM
jgi:hypothetical protein